MPIQPELHALPMYNDMYLLAHEYIVEYYDCRCPITYIRATCTPWRSHPEHVSHPTLGGLRAGGGAAGIISISGTGGTAGEGASSEPTQEITHLGEGVRERERDTHLHITKKVREGRTCEFEKLHISLHANSLDSGFL